jgi:hypothetical protein
MNNSYRNETIKQLVESYTVGQFNELYLADGEFRKFARQVYTYFDNMRPGTRLRLTAYQGRKLEWVLLTYVAFYFEGAHWLEFFISDDYNTILLRNIAPEDFDREVEQWLKWKREHQR